MGFYGEQVLPRIISKLGDTKAVREVRDETCRGLRGDVIELGFGSGLNVPRLPSTVAGVWAVEPSDTAMKLAQNRIDASPIPVQRAGLDGEKLDEPDDRFDGAISFMTLCTIPDADAALGELRRVLKAGGRVPLRRARALAGRQGRAHAGPVQHAPEPARRRMQPEPRDRRAHHRRRLRDHESAQLLFERRSQGGVLHVRGRGSESVTGGSRILPRSGGLTEWPKVLAC